MAKAETITNHEHAAGETRTTRRALLVAAAAAPTAAALPGAALALPSGMPAEWRAFILNLAAQHPNGAEAAAQAYVAGLKLSDLQHVALDGSPVVTGSYPMLWFAADFGGVIVHPEGPWEYHWRPRFSAAMNAARAKALGQ